MRITLAGDTRPDVRVRTRPDGRYEWWVEVDEADEAGPDIAGPYDSLDALMGDVLLMVPDNTRAQQTVWPEQEYVGRIARDYVANAARDGRTRHDAAVDVVSAVLAGATRDGVRLDEPGPAEVAASALEAMAAYWVEPTVPTEDTRDRDEATDAAIEARRNWEIER